MSIGKLSEEEKAELLEKHRIELQKMEEDTYGVLHDELCLLEEELVDCLEAWRSLRCELSQARMYAICDTRNKLLSAMSQKNRDRHEASVYTRDGVGVGEQLPLFAEKEHLPN